MPDNKQSKPPLSQLLHQHKKAVGFFAFVVLLISISLLLRSLTAQIPTPVTSEWFEVRPGQVVEDLNELEKQAIDKTSDGRSTTFSFQSTYPVFPHTIKIDEKSGKVTETRQMLPPDTDELLEKYVKELGEPNLVLYHSPTGGSVLAHVYLAQGIVIIAHIDGGVIEEFWQILPTTEEVFMGRYGDEFTTTMPGQEGFEDQVEEGVGIEPDFTL